MTEHSELADYADMHRTMAGLNPIDVLDGQTCPDPGCVGTVVRNDDGAVCRVCGRWVVRFN